MQISKASAKSSTEKQSLSSEACYPMCTPPQMCSMSSAYFFAPLKPILTFWGKGFFARPDFNLKGTYLKNGLLRSIAHVIKHANFQLYRVHMTELFTNLTIDTKFINKRVQLFIHQTICQEEKTFSTSQQGCEIPV